MYIYNIQYIYMIYKKIVITIMTAVLPHLGVFSQAISEKSIIRPTFSYMGKFTISDTVFRQILEYLASKTPGIYKILKTRVENYGEGVKLYMEVTVVYGTNVVKDIKNFKEKVLQRYKLE